MTSTNSTPATSSNPPTGSGGQPSASPDTGITESFTRFISTTTFDDLPMEVVEAVKFVVLDTLAVAVAGIPHPAPQRLAALLQRYGSSPLATAVGQPFRCDPASAAFINGTTAHALDYDDYCFAMSGHPSTVILPAILSLAETRHMSGRDLITAYAVGFEAAIMLSRIVNPDHYGHGWHGTGTVGAVGATSAAANLLGLSREQVRNAIALGASSAAGLRQNFGTDIKPLHAGNAARAAVLAAELAESGFTGNAEPLEGRWGFFNVFTPGPLRERRVPDDDAFGAPWSTLQPGITTKLFPSCGSTHTAIGGALHLRDEGLKPEDVARIDVALTDISAGNLQYPRPRTGLEAKFSLQYCVARALVDGSVELDHFDDAAVADEAVQALIPRIHMHHDPALTAAYVWGTHRPAVLTVETASGDSIEHRADVPPGAPGNFSADMLHTKVRDCMRRGEVAGTPDELIAAVNDLERCDDVTQMTRLLAGPSTSEQPRTDEGAKR